MVGDKGLRPWQLSGIQDFKTVDTGEISKHRENGVTILVVDDDPATQQVIVKLLPSYTFVLASSGAEALSLLQEGLQPQAVLLEVRISPELLPTLRHQWSFEKLPILLLATASQREALVSGLAAGANDFLTKPMDKEELLVRLRTYVRLQQLNQQTLHLAQESEKRFIQFLEVMPVGVQVLDGNCKLFYQNPKSKQVMGEAIAQLPLNQWPAFCHLYIADTKQFYPADKLPLWRAFQGETATVDDVEISQADQVNFLEMTGTPIFDEQGRIVYVVGIFKDITKRREAEALVQENQRKHLESLEAKFRYLAVNVPGVVYQWYERQNGERGFYYVSPRCEDFYGVTAEAWQADWKILPIHPEDLPRWEESLRQAIEQKKDWSFEGRFILPSGEIKWWGAFANIMPVDEQETIFNGIIIDIMEQKKMEAALREKEKILADAQRMALLGSWVWDIKTGTVQRSEQDCRNYGLPPENYTPTYEAFIKPVHPDDIHIIDSVMETCIIEGRTAEFEFRVIWPTGQIRTIRSQTELEFNADGTPIRLKGFSQDITERKLIEQALEQRTRELMLINRVAQMFSSTLKLEQIFETILGEMHRLLDITASSFWLVVPATNELVCQYTQGPDSETAIGLRLALGQGVTGYSAQTGKAILVPDTQAEMHPHKIELEARIELRSLLCIPLLVKGKVIGVLNLADTKVGRFTENDLRLLEPIAAAAANAIENARLYTLSQQELLERKRAEEQIQRQNLELHAKNSELERLTEKLAQAQQEEMFQLNKAYERFVPRQFLSLLDKQSVLEVQLGDQIEREMTIMFSDIRGFTAISEGMTPQEIFDFVNNFMGQMEPIIIGYQGVIDKYIGDAIMAVFPSSADDAVRGAIAMLSTLNRYNQLLERAGLPQIRIGIGLNTGPLMLGTVGGQNRMDGTVIADAVNLASRVEELTKTYKTPLLITEQTYLKLTNESQYQIRVIDVVRVKGKSQLVTIYEVYDADSPASIALKNRTRDDFEAGFVLYHSGEVQDAQKLFEQVLQTNREDEAAQVYLERCKQALSMRIPEIFTILIVDDVLDNVSVLFEFLTQHKFEVLVAESGKDALQVVKHEKPHLILLDIMMPNIDGFETCKQFKANPETRDIPIIFMSALSEIINKVKGFELGAVDYITKPFQQEEVLARIRAHLSMYYLQQQLQVRNSELEKHNVELKGKLRHFKREDL